MDCERCQEALSARLDGEPEGASEEWTRAHLEACVDCRNWERQAFALTRSLRLRPAEKAPDLAAGVLEQIPARRVRVPWWRVALAIVAFAQIVLGLAQVLGWDGGMASAHGAMGTHLFDESTAWNLAVGLGMGWVAWRVRAAGGVLPLLGSFLVVLAWFCVRDLIAGDVTVARVASHGLLAVGFALMLVVYKRNSRPHRPASVGGQGSRSEADMTGADEEAPQQRRRSGGTGLRPVSRRAA